MTVDTATTAFNIDRKVASKLLKISIRTVDRYIKSKKLSTRLIDGRVWLDKGEIEAIRLKKLRPTRVDNRNVSTPPMSIDVDVDKVDNIDIIDQPNVDFVSTRIKKRKRPSGTYKKLYGELKQELREKQERLEIANYRVGQLEAQVKNSVPMLEYHRENYQKSKKEGELKDELTKNTKVLYSLARQIKFEKFNKRIFLIVLLVVLALQPLWLLLFYN